MCTPGFVVRGCILDARQELKVRDGGYAHAQLLLQFPCRGHLDARARGQLAGRVEGMGAAGVCPVLRGIGQTRMKTQTFGQVIFSGARFWRSIFPSLLNKNTEKARWRLACLLAIMWESTCFIRGSFG